MKSAFRIVSLAVLFACAECALADITVRQNIVGPGTSSRAAEFAIASGASADVTITADEGFVISSIVTNGVPVGEVCDFTGQSSATVTIASEDDLELAATFVTENAWWLDPFVRNNLYVAPTGQYPDGCSLDPDEEYFLVSEGYSMEPPGIHMYDVAELKNSIDNSLVALKFDNVEFVEGESGETVAVSSRFGSVLTSPAYSDAGVFAVRPADSAWEDQENFECVSVDNLDEYGFESLGYFIGGAFGAEGFYFSDGAYVFLLEPDVDEVRSVITNFHIAECWECPIGQSWSLNVKTISGVDYVFGVSAGNDTANFGNATLYVLDTDNGDVVASAFQTEEIDPGDGLVSSVYGCYGPVQIVGFAAGTPRVVVKDDSFSYILDLDSDGMTLVSPYPVKSFIGNTDQDNLYDSTISDIGGLAVTDDETRMFNICGYFLEAEEVLDESVDEGLGDEGGADDGDEGEGDDEYYEIRLKVFEKAPEKIRIEGVFEYSDEEVRARVYTVSAGSATNIVYSVPEGYIKSVTTNGIPVADFIKGNAYEFSSESVDHHVFIRMEVIIGVAKIGNEEYTSVDAALLEAQSGDTIELIADTYFKGECTVDKDVTIDTCGFILTNNTSVTIGSSCCLVITNSMIDTGIRSFVNSGRVIIESGALLDIHAVTLTTASSKVDLEDGGSYEIKSGGTMFLPDVFRSWCYTPYEVEHEGGDYNYLFFDGTEVGAMVCLNRGYDGGSYFVCTGIFAEPGGNAHAWNTVIASYGGVSYYTISNAVEAAEADSWNSSVMLLADTTYALSVLQTVKIDLNGYNFTPSVPEGYSVCSVTDNGITTYSVAKNIDSAVVTIAPVTYDGGAHVPHVTVTDGDDDLVENVDYVISGGPFTDAGSHSFDIIGTNRYASSISKTFTITPANFVSHSVAQSGTLTYNGEAQAVSVTESAVTVGSQPYTFTYSATQDGYFWPVMPTFANAGEHTIYYQVSAPNHNTASGSFTVTIAKKVLTVTARDTTALYGEDPFYMVSYSGFVDGENALVFKSFPTVSGAYKPKTKATWTQSSYTITPSGAAADNYEFSYVSGTLTVNRRNLTNVSVAQTGELTEDGTPQVATVSATATAALDESVTFTYSATQNGTYSSLVPAFTDAGTYTVYYKANANYHNEATGTFVVTIAEGGPDEEPEMISAAFVGADGKFHVTVAGTDSGRDYTAYTASDLSVAFENWTAGQVIQGNGGSITFELTLSAPKKFVRVVSSRHK